MSVSINVFSNTDVLTKEPKSTTDTNSSTKNLIKDSNTESQNYNNSIEHLSNRNTVTKNKKQFSFIKRLNPFDSESLTFDSSIKSKLKVDDVVNNKCSQNLQIQKDNIQSDVKSLKKFWNNHILNTQKSVNVFQQKSATLTADSRLGDFRNNKREEKFNESWKYNTFSNFSDISPTRTISTANSKFNKDDKKISVSDEESDKKIILGKLELPLKDLDNFNKYKSANLIKNTRNSNNLSTFQIPTSSIIPFSLPLVAITSNGIKIHWAKRNDILNKPQNAKDSALKDNICIQQEVQKSDKKVLNHSKKLKNYEDSLMKIGKDILVSDMVDMIISDDSSNRNKIKISRRSSNESISSKPSRKISFKTQKNVVPTNSYNRKLKHENTSRVAALTLRFNQMIQQDKQLLHEVQNKGKIVHKVGGNVYKIVEEDPLKSKKRENSNDDASSASSKQSKKQANIRRKASMKHSVTRQSSKEKTVKEKIKLFEPTVNKFIQDNTRNAAKPKVPDKSETVKQKSEELKRLQKQNHTYIDDNANPFSTEKIEENINNTFPHEPKTVLPSFNTEEKKLGEEINHIHYVQDKSSDQSSHSKVDESLKCHSLFTTMTKISCSKTEKSSPLLTNTDNDRSHILMSTPNINLHLVQECNAIETTPISSLMEIQNNENQTLVDYKPNASFLFRNAEFPQHACYSTNDIQSSLVEAINEALINKARSMDEITFPHDLITNNESICDQKFIFLEENRLISTIKGAEKSPIMNEIENDYEYIKKPTESFDKIQTISNETRQNKEIDDITQIQSIYQTLEEIHLSSDENIMNLETKNSNRNSVNSYESFDEPYESLDDYRKSNSKSKGLEVEYEISAPPEPPPPRNLTIQASSSHTEHTKLSLPVPKRNIQRYSDPYKGIKYTHMSTTPKNPNINILDKQQAQLPLPPRNNTCTNFTNTNCVTPENESYEENIYDTIKHSDDRSLLSICYEAIQERSKLTGEPNCLIYDTVKTTNFNRFPQFLKHADSTLTLSSDQKTNSIYGTTVGQSITPPSERGSDNSDEWVDISDEENKNMHTFVVIREKTKVHRSPEWSRKVRDQHRHHITNPEVNSTLCEDEKINFRRSILETNNIKLPNIMTEILVNLRLAQY